MCARNFHKKFSPLDYVTRFFLKSQKKRISEILKFFLDLLSLGLADNRIGDEGAASLAELIRQTDTLQKVTLSGNDIHDEGGTMLMAALSQNTSLQGLYLAGVSSQSQCVKKLGTNIFLHKITLPASN